MSPSCAGSAAAHGCRGLHPTLSPDGSGTLAALWHRHRRGTRTSAPTNMLVTGGPWSVVASAPERIPVLRDCRRARVVRLDLEREPALVGCEPVAAAEILEVR